MFRQQYWLLVAAGSPFKSNTWYAAGRTYSLRATRAKPLAAGAVVSLAGAEPPNIWNSMVPKNSASTCLRVSLRICPVVLMYGRSLSLHHAQVPGMCSELSC